MKSIFDEATRQELVARVSSLSLANNAQWGKMDAFQMAKHCTLCDEMILGNIKINRVLIGRLIGKMILKKTLKDDSPFGRNSPTSPLLKTLNESGNLRSKKKNG